MTDSVAVATLDLSFSFGGSSLGGYANFEGGALETRSIFGIFRSPLRQITAVGCKANERKCV